MQSEREIEKEIRETKTDRINLALGISFRSK
jgi:hypothetical protein